MSTETLERAFASTRQVLGNVKPDQLSDPSPCQSWTVREVINHVIGGTFWFAGSMNDGKAPAIPDSDFTGGDMGATYDDGIKQAVAAFGAPGAMEKMVELPFGSFPGAFFIQLATTDAFTHGWDIAKATGQSSDLDPEVATQLLEGARVAIQPAFRGEDGKAPFGLEQQPPANATAADKLAAFLGRICEP
jgi:uncharacterized protein (TIGR03086 family)